MPRVFRPARVTVDGVRYFVARDRSVLRIDANSVILEHITDEPLRLHVLAEVMRIRRNRAARSRDAALRSLGLVKVRGALGGTYWE